MEIKGTLICWNVSLTFSINFLTATTSKNLHTKPLRRIFRQCTKNEENYRKLQIWSHLLNKTLMKIFIFCAVCILSELMHEKSWSVQCQKVFNTRWSSTYYLMLYAWIKSRSKSTSRLVVSNLHSKTKGSRFESGC